MLKKSVTYIIMVCIAAAFCSCRQQNSLPDLRETYAYKDTKPFGAFAAHELFKKSYPGSKIEIIKEAFADNYAWDYDTASVYINISKHFYSTERDANSLMDFVYKGNTALIAAADIDSTLLNKIYCKQDENYTVETISDKPFRKTAVTLIAAITPAKDSFQYFYKPFSSYFSQLNGSYARKAGYNDDGKTNFFVFFWGKGRLYLHAEPKAFSNYFLLTKNNYEYLQHISSMLPAAPQNIYWDNFYNKKNYKNQDDNNNFSTFSTIMKYPPLKKAFWIALVLLLLYIFFNSKRRQRIVPIVKKPENTSIAFAEAIAGLYLTEKDNKLIAEKIVTYFNEYLRTKYFITGSINDPAYADTLSRKSGVAVTLTTPLINEIKAVGGNEKITDQQLLTLNGLIEKFYKNKA